MEYIGVITTHLLTINPNFRPGTSQVKKWGWKYPGAPIPRRFFIHGISPYGVMGVFLNGVQASPSMCGCKEKSPDLAAFWKVSVLKEYTKKTTKKQHVPSGKLT